MILNTKLKHFLVFLAASETFCQAMDDPHQNEESSANQQLRIKRVLENVIKERDLAFQKTNEINAFIKNGDYEQALTILDDFLKSGNRYTGSGADWLRTKASCYYHLSDYENNISIYSQLIEEENLTISDSINLVDTVYRCRRQPHLNLSVSQKSMIQQACNTVLSSDNFDAYEIHQARKVLEKMKGE